MKVKGILGRKIGMTQVFTNSGKLIPVTVVSVELMLLLKSKQKKQMVMKQFNQDLIQNCEKLATKASVGHTNKAKTTPKRFFKEIKGVDINDYSIGQEIKVDIFEAGEIVDVTGTTKDKGFQGVIKRHNQSRGPMGHGSHYHRKPGSMGTMRPMRVFKGKKLPGHMGTLTVTIQNLEIIAVDLENNCLLVKGNVPGAKNSLVIIKSAVKSNGKINKPEELTSYEIIENVPNEKDLEPAEENALENAEASESEEA